ncbi:peptidyl-prolyl cis-trans isomerase [Mesonia aquimarina]|uniref:peptidyl-prolyl cis-trans isomerase n=1 Tax=Mesonia aquimarina TaxID=1504967 RepID=UPI000EF606C1|nr:peptidyl-prolyl cis-trans isomerase [Mesonia aquimarina]
MSKYLYIFVTLIVLTGCQYFEQEDPQNALARVNNAYLFEGDIQKELPKNIAKEDSLLLVNNIITRWATEQLLMDQAKINLPEKQQQKFEQLIANYKKELYTEAYKDIIISKQLDTNLTEAAIESYFEANRNNFKLNQDLVKLRYIHLNENFPEKDKIKERFNRFNQKDREFLENESLKFNSISLNDSIWVSARNIYEEVKPLDIEDKQQFLQKDKFLQLQDSTGVYLVKVKDVLLRNDKAPLEYVKPTIKQILLNRRKLELAKKIEKEITKDALKSEKFEIYN